MKIISAATTEPITLAQARKQCKVDAEGSPPTHEDDDLITIYMKAAREWCEKFLGAQIAPSIAEMAFTSFTDTIAIEGGPVAGVVGISYFDEDGTFLAVDPAVYALDTTEQVAVIRLNTDQAWPTTNGENDNIKIQYALGYSIPGDSPQDAPLPSSVKAAILLLLAHLYKNRESTVEQALSVTPMGVRFLLAQYQIRRGFA